MYRMPCYLFLILLALLLSLTGCKEKDRTPDALYNFSSLDKFTEWYDGHVWTVGAIVSADPENKKLMFIKPEIECLQKGYISYENTYGLSINELTIPLRVEHSGGDFRVVVNYDSIDTEIAIKQVADLQIVFRIDGKEEINYIVPVPSEVTLSPLASPDLSQPINITWQTANNPDAQILTCQAVYHPQTNKEREIVYRCLVPNNDRKYLLTMNKLLERMSAGPTESAPAEQMKLTTLTLDTANYEEQYWHIIYAKRHVVIKT